MIDVQRLAVFREVARAGSFAGAAAVLRHTPSAVSQQIAALERGVGVELVHRSTRGVTLTAAGQVLLGGADAVHGELIAVERRLHELAVAGSRELTVATFPSAGERVVAPALTRLTQQDDSLQITVIEAEPPDALTLLRDGAADLALVYHFHQPRPPAEWRATMGVGSYHRLLTDEIKLVVPARHPLAERRVVGVDEVSRERWIHGWGQPGGVLDTLAAAAGFEPLIACRSSDYRFVSALVGAAVGVALIPMLALTADPAVRALRLTQRPTRYVGVLLPRRATVNPLAEELVAILRQPHDNLWHGGTGPS